MKNKPRFDEKKAINPHNSVFISKMLDPLTAKFAKTFYRIGFTADMLSITSFALGMFAVFIIAFLDTYFWLVIAALLITLRNFGDTIDGKIARGSGVKSPHGGFMDIIFDWIFFHPLFYMAVGYSSGNIFLGMLCIVGYMSREFTRRKFEIKYGQKAKNTKEAEKIPGIVSVVKKYTQADVFWLIPIFLVLNRPAIIIFAVAIIEYMLLFAELGFYAYCFSKKKKPNKYLKPSPDLTT